MAHRILLTGAGFSKNWGGYLAREIWERLLGHPNIRADAELRRALLAAPEDFEAALTAVRRLFGASQGVDFETSLGSASLGRSLAGLVTKQLAHFFETINRVVSEARA